MCGPSSPWAVKDKKHSILNFFFFFVIEEVNKMTHSMEDLHVEHLNLHQPSLSRRELCESEDNEEKNGRRRKLKRLAKVTARGVTLIFARENYCRCLINVLFHSFIISCVSCARTRSISVKRGLVYSRAA